MHMTQCCCVCSPCCASEFQNFLCLQSKFGTLPVVGPPPVRRESASDPARKGDHAAAVRLHLAHFTQRNALRGAYNPSALWHMARLPPLQKPHNARCVCSFPYPPPSVALSPPRSVPVVSGASDPIRRLFSLCAPYPERVAMGAPLHPSLQRLPQVTPHQQGVSALSPHPHRYLQSSLTFPGHTCRDVGPGIRLAVPLGQRVQAAAATSPREGRPAPASPFQHGESPAEVALT